VLCAWGPVLNARTFTIEGIPYAVVQGREIPGLPSWHVVRADTGAHVSLAYPEGDGALFDDRMNGYRLNVDGTVTRYKAKAEYYQARKLAGWPVRKRRGKA
jgi:hypothetical protein